MKGRARKLADALRDERDVRVARAKLDDASIYGVVRLVGREWFVMATESDFVPFGFVALRVDDVTDLDASAESAEVAERVRALQRRAVPAAPEVDVSALDALLRTATDAFPLVTLHLEERLPDVCYVGRVVETRRRRLVLRSITPAGAWEDEPTEFKLAHVTRVDFGGPYEAALAQLAADDERKARAAKRRKKA